MRSWVLLRDGFASIKPASTADTNKSESFSRTDSNVI